MQKKLNDWNLEFITSLLETGHTEDFWFDFKQCIPTNKKDKKGVDRFKRVISSFANAQGGFIVVGISDDSTLVLKDRLLGVPSGDECAVQFGNLLSSLEPRPEFRFKNPPIKINANKVIHVFEIIESVSKPVAVEEDGVFAFNIRTAKGTAPMTYQEVRDDFMGYAFIKDKIVLLHAELKKLVRELGFLGAGETGAIGHSIKSDTISSCLFHAHGLLKKEPFFVDKLNDIRTDIELINSDIQSNLTFFAATGYGGHGELSKRNNQIRSRAQDLKRSIENFLSDYKSFLSSL